MNKNENGRGIPLHVSATSIMSSEKRIGPSLFINEHFFFFLSSIVADQSKKCAGASSLKNEEKNGKKLLTSRLASPHTTTATRLRN